MGAPISSLTIVSINGAQLNIFLGLKSPTLIFILVPQISPQVATRMWVRPKTRKMGKPITS